MKEQTQRRKICDSWYHQRWFRILLIIVGIDMIILGGTFAIGLDLIAFLGGINPLFRLAGGIAYILVALFIIHYAMSYKEFKRNHYFVCQHCALVK